MTLSLGLVKSRSSFHRDPLLGIGKVQILPSSRPSPWDWSSSDPPLLTTLSLGMVTFCVLLSDNDPLLGNDQVRVMALSDGMVIDLFLYIKALYDGMVIDFFLYIKTLSDEMVIDFFLYIKALSDGMVIDFFLYIKTLSDGMVIDFLMFTSRPSPMEWSLIFFCLHQGPLRWNGL
ncbi:hypothetical protein DEO72_LG7g1425 [Vigna unguiculata]|uniref:Uncharacterized protein n=1 Tax=Vigna unguiculata TaxID=3917 RepID=A0A4D6MIX1_VIGUN|nr:hypothetical protein DEO72_LG7g1425 [Vigna unguiculata]